MAEVRNRWSGVSENLNVIGLDVYFGRGSGFAEIISALASIFEISTDAIVSYESDEAMEVPKFSRWALIHQIGVDSIFAFKADVEMNVAFDWLPTLKRISSDLGVLVACPDENSLGDDMLCVMLDGSVEVRYIDPSDYES